MSKQTISSKQQAKLGKGENTPSPITKEMVGAVVLAQMMSVALPDPVVNQVICEALRVLQKTLSDDSEANFDVNINKHPDVIALATGVQEMATKTQ